MPDYTWTATLTGNIIVECWGSGGGGANSNGFGGGTGGGGGAYARKAGIAVTNGVGYLVRVGAAGTPNNNGNQSYFNLASTVMAREGGGGVFGAPGYGGDAATSVGDVKRGGGTGGSNSGGQGGGGGSSPDDASPAVNGSSPNGGNAPDRGGDGGSGGLVTLVGPPVWDGTDGSVGSAPAGGGGGGAYGNPVGRVGAAAGDGAVVIWADLGVWPPTGQSPIATYGGPVPPFPAPPFNAKATKRGFVMSFLLAALLALPGCPGFGGGVSCTRYPDGRVECSVEAHNDGDHSGPVR